MSDQIPHDEELAAAYRKLPASEPRAEIDQAILAVARRKAKRRAVIVQLRSFVPFAAAAAVILTLALVRDRTQHADEAARLKQIAQLEKDEAEGTARTKLAKINRDRQIPPTHAAGAAEAQRDGAAEGSAKSRAAEAPAVATKKAKPEAAAAPPQEQLRSLGYLRGSDDVAATQPAAPPTPEAKPAPPPAVPHAHRGQFGEPESQPEMGIAGNAESGTDALAARPDSGAEVADSAACEGEPAPVIIDDVWPFGLEAGLDETEACRRVDAAFPPTRCEFHDGSAMIPLGSRRLVDRGRLAGREALSLTLTMRDGKLWRLGLTYLSPNRGSDYALFGAPEPAAAPAVR